MSSNYSEYSNELYIGYYKLWRPAILVRDPELIKDMVTTNFNSFHINDTNVSKRYDPLMSASPFFKENIQEWKESRRTVSALFSPSKVSILCHRQKTVKKSCRFQELKISG